MAEEPEDSIENVFKRKVGLGCKDIEDFHMFLVI